MFTKITHILLFSFLAAISGNAQFSNPQESSERDSISTSESNNVGSIFYGQPGKAALYSAIIPGGGQIYNKRYWKAPIIWGLEGYAIYHLTKSISNSKATTSCWMNALDATMGRAEDCSVDVAPLVDNLRISEAFDERQSARSQKDLAWILFSAAHLLNVVEAFVDRHLINFDVSEDLSFHNRPSQLIMKDQNLGSSITLVRVTIPIGR